MFVSTAMKGVRTMAFDPHAFALEWLAALNAERVVIQERKEVNENIVENDELSIEQIDVRIEAITEWLAAHP
jgi:hypothetical protein